MFWRHRKVLRDRAAGMVFDWRRGHGSARRLVIASIVSASFWGALLAYVQIREQDPPAPNDNKINLTVVDLDAEESRWLAVPIDRETLFHQRWDIMDPGEINTAIKDALAANSPRVYDPTLKEVSLPEPRPRLKNLPGYEAGVLPEPEPVGSVVFASPPVNWWIEVAPVDGPGGVEKFAFPWENREVAMSEGEVWTILIGVDWRGRVIVSDVAEKADDERTSVILDQCRKINFPSAEEEGPLRWWKFEAVVANRPISE